MSSRPLLAAALLTALLACDAPDDQRRGRSWSTPPLAPSQGGVIAARLPRTVYRGGPFLRNPEVTTVTFAGDDPATIRRI